MERKLFFLFLLTILTGVFLKSPSLLPAGLGLSLFIPSLTFKSLEERGVVHTLIVSASSLLILSFLSRESLIDVSSILLLGFLFYLARNREVGFTVLLGALALTLTAVLEEFLFGIPKELGELRGFLDYRYGIYFMSSSLFTYVSYGFTRLFNQSLPPLVNLKFGFWVVLLFLFLGILSFVHLCCGYLIKDLLIASLSLIMLQGLSVSLWFWLRLPGLWKLITAVSIIIFPVVIFAVSIPLGLFDYMLNFRKLNGGRKDEGNSD